MDPGTLGHPSDEAAGTGAARVLRAAGLVPGPRADALESVPVRGRRGSDLGLRAARPADVPPADVESGTQLDLAGRMDTGALGGRADADSRSGPAFVVQ